MEYKIIKISSINKNDYNAAYSLLTEERKAYFNNVSSDQKIKASVLGEWLVKRILNKAFSIPLNNITVLRTEKGKPYIKDSNLHISISHSGDFVCAAVGDTPFGIDIEVIKNRDLKIIRKLCSENDEAFIKSAENPLLTFYKIWTAKEAYFKMTGSGITNLKSISYSQLNATHYFESDLIITIVK